MAQEQPVTQAESASSIKPIKKPEVTILSDHAILGPTGSAKAGDNPESDGFDLDTRLAAAFDILRHRSTQTPITIAIYGDWGTGKSSGMRYLQDRLAQWNRMSEADRGGHPKVHTVWFDPWKYGTRIDVWRGLIAEVILHCIDVANLETGDKAKRLISAAGEFGLFLGRSFLHALKSISIKAQIVDVTPTQAIDAVLSDYKQVSHPEKAFLNEFEATLRRWIERYIARDERLAIFIDDLDRCLPPVTLEVLEALKLYLNIPKLIFVVGLDPEVVRGIVRKHYADNGLGERKADSYLEKLFQVEIHIPPSDQQIKEFLAGQIRCLDDATEGFWTKQLTDASSPGEPETTDTTYKTIVERQIEYLCRGNPRQVKRLLNSALLRAAAAYNANLEGLAALRFAQGAQVFLIQQLMEFRGFPQPARLLLQDRTQHFFNQWSKFIQQYPDFRPFADRPPDGIRDVGEITPRDRADDDRPTALYGELLAMRPRDAEGNVLELEKEERLWGLLQIPFSIEVAASVPLQAAEPPAPPPASPPSTPAKPTRPQIPPATPASLADMPDVVRRAIARALDKPVDVLTGADLKMLKSLDLSGSDLTDLSPLASLTGLRVLNLSWTTATDLSPLASLTDLQQLSLSSTRVTDFSPLASLTGLWSLYLSSTRVTDLSPLTSLTALRRLDLHSTQVTDLSPLASLTDLERLGLRSTRVTDLSPLASLTALQELNLSDTQVSDLSPLASLTDLQVLHLHSTQVTDLSPLASLTGLQRLNLSSTPVTDLSPLASLTRLQVLYLLGSKQVTDLSPLKSLTALQELDLSFTQVTDLSPLASLTGLQWLYLHSAPVTDLSPLASLTGLQKLDLSGARVGDAQITQLKKALPNVVISG